MSEHEHDPQATDVETTVVETSELTADHVAAGYNAEPSEAYDPAAAHAGDGYPEAPATEEDTDAGQA